MLSVTLTFLGMDPSIKRSSYFISISLLHMKYIGKKKLLSKVLWLKRKLVLWLQARINFQTEWNVVKCRVFMLGVALTFLGMDPSTCSSSRSTGKSNDLVFLFFASEETNSDPSFLKASNLIWNKMKQNKTWTIIFHYTGTQAYGFPPFSIPLTYSNP